MPCKDTACPYNMLTFDYNSIREELRAHTCDPHQHQNNYHQQPQQQYHQQQQYSNNRDEINNLEGKLLAQGR